MNYLDRMILTQFEERINQESNVTEFYEMIQKKGIRNAVFEDQSERHSWFDYNRKSDHTDVNDQGITGRCWIYAAANVINEIIIKEHHLKNFTLSENFVAFYDLLEKANYFLEIMIEKIQDKTDDRVIWMFLQRPIQDAGQWFFFQNIIEKYGIVTKEAMPNNKVTENTNELIDVLSDLLKEYTGILRSYYKDQHCSTKELISKKNEIMYDIYRLLVLTIGKPPLNFSCKLHKTNGEIVCENMITPYKFYQKYIQGKNYNRSFCMLVNIPLENKEYYKNYSVRYLGNVWEAPKNVFTNLPMNLLKDYVIRQLEMGIPVWIGCDSCVYPDVKNGIYSTKNYHLEKLGFQKSFLDKKDNLMYGLSKMRHAMVIVGVSYDENHKVDKWLVKNSYGKKFGNNGYASMSDEWFSIYVYEAVILRELLSKELHDISNGDPMLLEPWDVLGTLAE